ncbi:MAG: hypothetical protein MZW92_01165 [Comamonadaceae bacterium]|nr:hypothetical protein [Comamonadaceae bacterium]
MVKVSYDQKPYRTLDDADLGRRGVRQSPTHRDQRRPRASWPRTRTARARSASPSPRRSRTPPPATTPTTRSARVLNHVCLHQTVIGLEAKKQLELAGDYPDVVIGCRGGGSNFAGIAFPFLADKAAGKQGAPASRSSPTSCPTLTKGVYAYDFGDTARHDADDAKMYTLGHDFMPPGIHAGGLRYHGDSPLVSQLVPRRS